MGMVGFTRLGRNCVSYRTTSFGDTGCPLVHARKARLNLDDRLVQLLIFLEVEFIPTIDHWLACSLTSLWLSLPFRQRW